MKKKGKWIILAVIFVVIALFSSCTTTPVGVTSSITPLQNRKIITNLGPVQGKDSTFVLLGLWMFGRPEMDLAIRRALEKKGGDSLINVKSYETTSWYILFGFNTFIIEGDAVLFKTEEIKKDEKK
ncbi:MAG: hypothetical protein KKH98_15870 [Spirochaetes bacterium]|nr:hypothetical protein [Spirochaetota bacterium]